MSALRYSLCVPMRRRRLVARLIAAFLASLCAAAAGLPHADREPDAAEILSRSEEIRSPDLDYAVDFTLHVTNPNSSWKERRARYTMIAHGKDLSLVLMREPRQFYPGTLLIMRNLYWLIFPKSTKPIQLSARHILSGDISNGDLARGNLERHYDVKLDGEEQIDGRRCWRLELTRTSNVAHYPRIRAWISKRRLRPKRFEYYGRTGALLRTVHYGDYRKTALGVRAMRIEVDTHSRPGEKTTMEFSDLRAVDAARLSFTTDGLVKFRDAARALFAAEGRQARPEALIDMLDGDGS